MRGLVFHGSRDSQESSWGNGAHRGYLTQLLHHLRNLHVASEDCAAVSQQHGPAVTQGWHVSSSWGHGMLSP